MSKITYSDAYLELIYDRVMEMRAANISETLLDEEHFGNLKVYINTQPESFISAFEVENDAGCKDLVYVGCKISA